MTERVVDEVGHAHVVQFPDNSQNREPVAGRLERIFGECTPRLIRFLTIRLGSRSEAEDAAQAAFLRIWQRRVSLTGENLVSLIFITARNIATDVLRERRRRQAPFDAAPAEGADIADIRDECASPRRSAQAQQSLDLIPSLIDELPPRCKAAFLAYKFEGLSYTEIAAKMGVTESMVRKYVLKALAHCAARFERLDGWE